MTIRGPISHSIRRRGGVLNASTEKYQRWAHCDRKPLLQKYSQSLNGFVGKGNAVEWINACRILNEPTNLVRPPPLRCGDCGLPFPPTISTSCVVPTDSMPLPFIVLLLWIRSWGEPGDEAMGDCGLIFSWWPIFKWRNVLVLLWFCLLMVLVFNGAKCARWPCGLSFKTASGLASD